ncbi:MAG: glycosyltransferase family 4 protein [Longimicrobiales bacterium]|nr:glycosyltransferase family 4 protein [Longimicrobiales bacterium]
MTVPRRPQLKILVVNWLDRLNPQAGGAETHLHEVFGRLAAWGHDITLLSSGFPGGLPLETLDGIQVHRVGSRMTFGLRLPFYLKSTFDPSQFHVVVEDLNKVPVFMPFWTRSPVVLLVHHLFGTTAFQEASFPVAAATWLLERPVPRVFGNLPAMAVSESTAADLRDRGMTGNEIAVVPNGVDLQRLTPSADGLRFSEPTILYLGRLKRYKGVDLILRSFARLRGQGVRVRLLIAGKGDYLGKLREMHSRMGLGDTVEFLGYVPEEEKIRLLQRSWIHVLASPKEGWGISILEAAACGTPTVASDSPGLRDAVQDGRTGLLVPHGDVDALSRALLCLLEDEQGREGMGMAARGFSGSFTWEASARKMEDFLLDRVAATRPLT